jgi:V/A-type H+/Na+-transporting ATPase subunit F
MKYYVVTDSTDTLVGLRLAGIEGTVARTESEAREALNHALEDRDIGILLVSEHLASLCEREISPLKRNGMTPLVLEIPDRHSAGRASDSITRYIREAIGIKL